MKRVFFLALFLLPAFCVGPASAHMLWLNPMNYYPQVGTTVEVGIGWGHKYPAGRSDQAVKADQVEAIQALDPDGRTVDLERTTVDRYRLKVDKAGAYIITARIKPGFFSMTPEGRKWGHKKEITNAVTCTHFEIAAKTVLIAGGDPKNFGAGSGQTLELIPESEPRQVKVGGNFLVRVMYQGTPLAGAQVNAVYAGFEEPKQGHRAATGKGHSGRHYPVETVTDDQGRTMIVPDRTGHWLIVLSSKTTYPDKETCDASMVNVTFAFEVR
jgi:uncharacterized GH25 family protein